MPYGIRGGHKIEFNFAPFYIIYYGKIGGGKNLQSYRTFRMSRVAFLLVFEKAWYHHLVTIMF